MKRSIQLTLGDLVHLGAAGEVVLKHLSKGSKNYDALKMAICRARRLTDNPAAWEIPLSKKKKKK